MKAIYKILSRGILLFIIINWATASLNYNADGADQYGFPLNFYTKVSGYDVITKEGRTSTNFNFFAFLADVTFALASSWLIFTFIDRFKKKANV